MSIASLLFWGVWIWAVMGDIANIRKVAKASLNRAYIAGAMSGVVMGGLAGAWMTFGV